MEGTVAAQATQAPTRAATPGPAATDPPGSPGAWSRRWQVLPWWAQVVVVSAGARLFSLLLLAAVARWAPPPGGRARPVPLLTELSLWDGGWYQRIVAGGYPTILPLTPDGAVRPNSWAFYPGFPLLLRSLTDVLSTPVAVVSAVLNPLLATAAALMLYRLIADGLTARTAPRDAAADPWDGKAAGALPAVALWCLAPAAPALSLLYAESLASALALAALLLLSRRRYAAAALPVVALGLTRPLGVPMAATVGIHLLVRLRDRGQTGRVRPAWPRVASVGSLVAAAILAAVAWPLIAGRVTGVPNAYLETMRSWRPNVTMAPFLPWWQAFHRQLPAVVAVLLLGLVTAAAVLPLTIGPGRRLPLELRVWTGLYAVYLAAVVAPTTSVVRYLVLGFGMWAALGLARRRGVLLTLAVAFVGGQVCWVLLIWHGVGQWGFPP